MELLTDFQMPIQNRFDCLDAREKDKENIQLSRQPSRQDFIASTVDEKLIHMFDELRFIRSEQVTCSTNIVKFHNSLGQISHKVGQVISVTNSQTELTRALAYKSIDLEARSRRNNLIFRGLTENRQENCFSMIREFLESKLDIDAREIYITRAHRLGGRIHGKNFNKRPIIVNFRDYGDIEYIMDRVYMLKKCPGFSVDYDFPREIQIARSKLWPKYKTYRAQNPRSKVSIKYPAKVIADGKVVYDELPQWNHYVNYDRLTQIEFISSHNTSPSTNKENYTSDTNHQMPEYTQQYVNAQNNVISTNHNSYELQNEPSMTGYASAQINQHSNLLYSQGENTGMFNHPCTGSTKTTIDNHSHNMSNVQNIQDSSYPQDSFVIQNRTECQPKALNTNTQSSSMMSNVADTCETSLSEHLTLIRDAASTLEHEDGNNSIIESQQIFVTQNSDETTLVKQPHCDQTRPKRIVSPNNNRETHVSRARNRSFRRNNSSSPYRRNASQSRNRYSPNAKNRNRSSDKSARTLPTRGQQVNI
jgi:hypothetical protein